LLLIAAPGQLTFELHEIGIVEMNSLKEQFVRAFIVPEKARPLFIAA
jgi:hypothetical protein